MTDALLVLTYAGIGALSILFVAFMLAPKRTRRTVNYLLNTIYEFKEAKEGKDGAKIEVPNFETVKMPKVPDPRCSKEEKP